LIVNVLLNEMFFITSEVLIKLLCIVLTSMIFFLKPNVFSIRIFFKQQLCFFLYHSFFPTSFFVIWKVFYWNSSFRFDTAFLVSGMFGIRQKWCWIIAHWQAFSSRFQLIKSFNNIKELQGNDDIKKFTLPQFIHNFNDYVHAQHPCPFPCPFQCAYPRPCLSLWVPVSWTMSMSVSVSM
jgi:hypothetical protein